MFHSHVRSHTHAHTHNLHTLMLSHINFHQTHLRKRIQDRIHTLTKANMQTLQKHTHTSSYCTYARTRPGSQVV